MSETPRTDAMQIFLWQHDETGRTCWMKTSPGPRWNRVGVPALCLLDDARQLERDLTAERERADRNQEDAERLDWMDKSAFTAYRDRDPEYGELYDFATVVNEDRKGDRVGEVFKTIREAIDAARRK